MFVLLLVGLVAASQVHVELQPTWAFTPMVPEASEFFAKESNAQFWEFALGLGVVEGNEEAQFEQIITVAKELLPPLKFDLLKFALNIHLHSPRVAVHKQLLDTAVQTTGASPCDTQAWVHIGDKFVCSIDDLQAQIGKTTSNTEDWPEIVSFDHVFPGSEAVVGAVLYAKIGTPEFRAFHAVLSDAAGKGDVMYVLRHWEPDASTQERTINVQGFGVELAIKNMEYKAVDDSKIEGSGSSKRTALTPGEDIQGFLFDRLVSRRADLEEKLLDFRSQLLRDVSEELEQVKAWQMKDLGFLASQRVLAAEDPLAYIRDLSQNFPSRAAALSRRALNESLVDVIQRGKQFFMPGDSYLFINGRMLDPDTFNPYSLLLTLDSEAEVVQQMAAMRYPPSAVDSLSDVPLQSPSSGVHLDIRSPHIAWLNNVAKDPMYRQWPSSVKELLEPTYPGQLKFIAKNVFNAVFVVNPELPGGLSVLGSILNFHRRSAPVRFGILLRTNDWADVPVHELGEEVLDAQGTGATLAKAFAYVCKMRGDAEGFAFLSEVHAASSGELNANAVATSFSQAVASVSDAMTLDVLKTDEFYAQTFYARQVEILSKGIPPSTMLVNGRLYQGRGVENHLVNAIHQATADVTPLVISGVITDESNIHDVLLSRDFVVQQYDEIVVPNEKNPVHIVPLTGSMRATPPSATASPPSLASFESMSEGETNALILSRLAYQYCKSGGVATVSHLIFVDLSFDVSVQQTIVALEQMAADSCSGVRVAMLNNPIDDPVKEGANMFARNVASLAVVEAEGPGGLLAFATSLRDGKTVQASLGSAAAALFTDSDWHAAALQRIAEERAFASRVGVEAGQVGFITNGRVVVPPPNRILSASSFDLLGSYERKERSQAIYDAMQEVEWVGDDEVTDEFLSDNVMRTVSLLAADDRRGVQRIQIPQEMLDTELAVFQSEGDPARPAFNIFAIVDPISVTAQRLAPLIMALRDTFNVNLKVILNPPHDVGTLPITKFYRYALDTSVTFDQQGRRVESAGASFDGLPTKYTLTMGYDVPPSWMVEAAVAVHDLDNIRLDDMEAGDSVYALYQLTHLLVEGNCYDTDRKPPTGLQLVLGTSAQEHIKDTIVMANLGYFQMKAAPGLWQLRLKAGRSSEVYTAVADSADVSVVPIILDTFSPPTHKLTVRKRPGMEEATLQPSGGSWLGNVLGGIAEEEPTLHVFSVASGHLYERFLKIMMLSVFKNTKNPVKFWFIKNFLSPKFKDVIPQMAAEYGFEVELVEYKWPRWLHAQTEKQRQIWGYKILFLDVLFPLAVEKVIFVDADQVVRADLKELYDMDLKGAPYGFTPFCDSREETNGFRFWASGYWKNHLKHLPYHISALFVVDLKKFRQISAGDTLRATYDGLSKDPNSLSNLDQDLPNQLQHQVPIFSLPQEWLWCETWCSDESKARAKTIDVCNNPLTKTPKLENAKRIIPEWVGLDEEVKELERRVSESTHTDATWHQAEAIREAVRQG